MSEFPTRFSVGHLSHQSILSHPPKNKHPDLRSDVSEIGIADLPLGYDR